MVWACKHKSLKIAQSIVTRTVGSKGWIGNMIQSYHKDRNAEQANFLCQGYILFLVAERDSVLLHLSAQRGRAGQSDYVTRTSGPRSGKVTAVPDRPGGGESGHRGRNPTV